MSTVVLITGGSTGLGYATAQALLETGTPYTILITSRTLGRAYTAAETLNSLATTESTTGRVIPLQLDLDDDDSILDVQRHISNDYGKLDILINNAGELLDAQVASGQMNIREAFSQSYHTNVTATHILTEALVPLILRSETPRIVFISSGLSSLTGHSDSSIHVNQSPPAGWPKPLTPNMMTYRIAKTGMNMMALEWDRILGHDGVKVHILDPGFLATSIHGSDTAQLKAMGALDPSDGGRFVARVVEGTRDNDVGKLISSGGVVPW